jgi:DNA-binding NarL/FixJ family response regulator
MNKRILIVDDHDVVRQGVLLILKSHPEWEIVGEAADGLEAISKVELLDPDLVILDISMPRKDGLEVLTELAQRKARARVLVLTMHDSRELSVALQRSGAQGYVVQTQAARDLVRAVQEIFAGRTFFPTEPSPTSTPFPEPLPGKRRPGMFRLILTDPLPGF